MAVAIQRLIDENLYWTMVHDRWVHEGNWRTFRDVVLGGLPLPQRRLLGPIARRGVREAAFWAWHGLRSAKKWP